MGADDWRYEYLSNELRDNKKRLEEAEKMVTEARSELNAAEWQRDKFKTIVEMLEVAYSFYGDTVNVTNRNKDIHGMSEPEYTFEAWKAKAGYRVLPFEIVSINKQGNMTLSDDLFERYFSHEFKGAEVFVDQKQKAIALKPSNDETKISPLHRVGTSPTARLSILANL